MVEYLSCEYFNSKHFKNIHYSKCLKIQISQSILFRFANLLPQIQWFKFDSKFNIDIQELQEKQ